MPQTINGIGTWYYGSKNQHARDDTCRNCGAHTSLRSYDTTKFFVLVYIPLIPLGRFRVVDQCAACTQHYAVPLKEWEEQRDEELSAASGALEADPWNGVLARALIQTCVNYHYRDGLDRFEARIGQALSTDPPGLAFLGSAYEYFEDYARAQASYRKSLALRDDSGARETLAIALLKQGNPADAKEFLWHLTRPGSPDNDPLLYFLVEAYQAQAKHSEADEVLRAMVQKNPALSEDAMYQRYRRRVEKRLGSFRPIASPLMKGKPLGYDGSRRFWIASTVTAAILAAVGVFLFQLTQRVDVHVLNGLDKVYSVRIDGKLHELPPYQALELSVRRGSGVFAEAIEAELGWASRVELVIPTGFWAAILDRNTYVLNPDQTAAIVWEQTEYRVEPVDKEMPSRLHVGRGFYTFANLDFVFEEFPDEIQLDSRVAVETRDRIWFPTELDPMDVYTAAMDLGAADSIGAYLVARLRARPEDETALGLAARVVPAAEFAELAEPHLVARPLEMQWHRVYQSWFETTGPVEELLNRYRGMLGAEPDNPDLMYLCARVTPDPDAAEELLRKATSSGRPSAYGFHGLSFQRLVEGRFEEAVELSRRAQELDPENAAFSYSEDEALLALRRYDVLLERNQVLRNQDPMNGEYVAEAVRLLVAKGDKKRARELIDTYMHELYETESDTAAWKNYLESLYHLGSREWKSFIERASASDQPRFRFQSELARGNHRAAIVAVSEASEASASDYFLAYLSARGTNDREAAEEYLSAAIELLSQRTVEERLLAECLKGAAPLDPMLKVSIVPELKSIGLAVLAERTGDARLRRLAKELSYQLTFERYYVDAALF
jgi:tetratricopeptide (TPR) repeat protein